MKTTVNKAVLTDALKKVANFTGKSGIETMVKIEVSGENVTVSTFNKNAYSSVQVTALESSVNGLTVTTFKSLNDFIKKVKSDQITLERISGDQLSVQAANINYKLLADNTNSFPIAPNERYELITLDVSEYKRILTNTVYAAATSESRPVLTGVNIHKNNDTIRFVATDSHRLGLYDLKQSIDTDINVVPAAIALEKSLKTLDKTTMTVQIGFATNFTLVKFDDTEIHVKNLDGNYPNTSRLIPDDFKTFVSVKTKQTLETLDVLKSVAAQDRNNVVKMKLNGKVELSTTDGINVMNAVLDGKIDGEDLTISYSLVYMQEALKALNETDVTINLMGAMRPFVINGNDSQVKHLILPVRMI